MTREEIIEKLEKLHAQLEGVQAAIMKDVDYALSPIRDDIWTLLCAVEDLAKQPQGEE